MLRRASSAAANSQARSRSQRRKQTQQALPRLSIPIQSSTSRLIGNVLRGSVKPLLKSLNRTKTGHELSHAFSTAQREAWWHKSSANATKPKTAENEQQVPSKELHQERADSPRVSIDSYLEKQPQAKQMSPSRWVYQSRPRAFGMRQPRNTVAKHYERDNPER